MVLLCQMVLSQDEPMVLISRIRMTRMCSRIQIRCHYHCLRLYHFLSWLVSSKDERAP